MGAASALALGILWGCSGSDTASTLEQPGTGGSAGTGGASGAAGNAGGATGGAAGSAKGGSAGNAGAANGGAAGSATGGAAGSATGGAAGTGGTSASWWPNAYDPNGTATIPSGNHNAGKDCLNCHTGTGEPPQWLFAGTIYDANGTAPIAHVEVGVKDPTGFYSAYSATNGNFWVPFTGTNIDWANAEARARDSNGELTMPGHPAAGCNSCHTGAVTIKAP